MLDWHLVLCLEVLGKLVFLGLSLSTSNQVYTFWFLMFQSPPIEHTWWRVHWLSIYPYMLYDILNGTYWEGREFNINWTNNDSKISTSRDLSWAAMSHISIMCSCTFLELSKVLLDSLFLRVLAKALLELTNYTSVAFINSLAKTCNDGTPNAFGNMRLNVH